MEWGQVWTIVGCIGAMIAPMFAFMLYMFNKLDSDIKVIAASTSAASAASNARIDKLYQMFVDLLKERK